MQSIVRCLAFGKCQINSSLLSKTKTPHIMSLSTSPAKDLALPMLPCICFTPNKKSSLPGHPRKHTVMCYYFFYLQNNYLTLL